MTLEGRSRGRDLYRLVVLIASLLLSCSSATRRGLHDDADSEGQADSDADVDVDLDADIDRYADVDADADIDGCLRQEICDDGLDNDCNRLVDDGCSGCPPAEEIAFDDCCWDGIDNDCDGDFDEGCAPVSPDWACIPRTRRFCGSDDNGGLVQFCVETGRGWTRCAHYYQLPEACVATMGASDFMQCLLDADECIQDSQDLDGDGDTWESIGTCRMVCPVQGCLCYPGAHRWCMLGHISWWGLQYCQEDALTWGRCSVVSELPGYEVCSEEGWFSPEFETCMVDRDACIQDMYDLDGDGDTWESLGGCEGIVCPG